MNPMEPKKLLLVVVVGVLVAVAGTAGLARMLRAGAERQLRADSERLVELQVELEEQTARAERASQATDGDGDGDGDASGGVPEDYVLTARADVVHTLQQLQALGDAAGIVIDGERALLATDAGRQPFVLTGSGSLRQLATFLAAIETHRDLMVVESGRLLPAGPDRVAFELGIATWHEGGGN